MGLNAGKVEKFSDNTCVSFVNLTVTKIDLVTRKKKGIQRTFETKETISQKQHSAVLTDPHKRP